MTNHPEFIATTSFLACMWLQEIADGEELTLDDLNANYFDGDKIIFADVNALRRLAEQLRPGPRADSPPVSIFDSLDEIIKVDPCQVERLQEGAGRLSANERIEMMTSLKRTWPLEEIVREIEAWVHDLYRKVDSHVDEFMAGMKV